MSSSLDWNSITLDDKPVQWLSDDYTTDIDHTGAFTEAIVTLPEEVAHGRSVTLDIQYGGTITQDSTRLTRMGAPEMWLRAMTGTRSAMRSPPFAAWDMSCGIQWPSMPSA